MTSATTTATIRTVQDEHRLLGDNLGRLGTLIEDLDHRHGVDEPELARLQEAFDEFSTDLQLHILEEEEFLFPVLRDALDGEPHDEAAWTEAAGRIEALRTHHDDFDRGLRRLLDIALSLQLPPAAEGDYEDLVDGLEDLLLTLRRHDAHEHRDLFPVLLERVGRQRGT